MSERNRLIAYAHEYRAIVHRLSDSKACRVLCEITFAVEQYAKDNTEHGFIVMEALINALDKITERKEK